ncbi:hypothetical protein HORM4_860037 [Vibrio harveyi]|nr:hypothetical protein HORM4_860037 [Vibrio harveyi]
MHLISYQPCTQLSKRERVGIYGATFSIVFTSELIEEFHLLTVI